MDIAIPASSGDIILGCKVTIANKVKMVSHITHLPLCIIPLTDRRQLPPNIHASEPIYIAQ